MLSDDLLEGAQSAASYICKTDRAVYHLVSKGQLPFVRVGKKLYFRKSELDAAFSANGGSVTAPAASNGGQA